MSPQPSWKVAVGMAKETTWGSPVSVPTVSWTTDKPSVTDKIDAIWDRSIRGIRAEAQALSFGAGHSEIDLPDMPFYGDDSGNLFMAILGTDTMTPASGSTQKTGTIAAASAGATTLTYTTVAGAGPVAGDYFTILDSTNGNEIVNVTAVAGTGPYTLTVPAIKYAHGATTPASQLFQHVLTLQNTTAPPSYTLLKYDALVATARQWAGIYWTELALKYTNPGSLTADIKGTGKLGSEVASFTPSYSAQPFFVPWQTSFTLAGVANARIVDFEFDLKAPSTQIFGMNATQSPTAAVPGRVSLTGKFTIAPDDYTEFNYYLNNTQPTTVVTMDNGSNRCTIQMTKTGFVDPVTLDHSSDHTVISASYEAISNATDAGTGNSPVKVVLLNQKSTSY